VLPSLSIWNGDNESRLANASAAERVIMMLVCARIFILKQLVQRTSPSAEPFDVRRRWVLLQALPPALFMRGGDIFVWLLRSLRTGDTEVMRGFSSSTVLEMFQQRPDLFSSTNFFAVLDEAQDAANSHIDFFPATSDPLATRSALHELYRVLNRTDVICGIILSGTGLSMNLVTDSVNSMSARQADPHYSVKIFTDTGNFLDEQSQKDYVLRYLQLSNEVYSDRRLLERIQTWFIGR
jgi:hypothetical protein